MPLTFTIQRAALGQLLGRFRLAAGKAPRRPGRSRYSPGATIRNTRALWTSMTPRLTAGEPLNLRMRAAPLAPHPSGGSHSLLADLGSWTCSTDPHDDGLE